MKSHAPTEKNSPGQASHKNLPVPFIGPHIRDVLDQPGEPLDPETRQKMETRFGHDFSQVRIHADASAEKAAKEVKANAFTVGSQIVFKAGKYAPGTDRGATLLAHELTHVAQQAPHAPVDFAALRLTRPDSAEERQAAHVAAAFTAHRALPAIARAAHSAGLARDPSDGTASVAKTGVSDYVYGLKFAKLGPMWMKVLLQKLNELSQEELAELRNHATAAEPYGKARLELAMDVVWYKKFQKAILPEFRQLLSERMKNIIPFADQQEDVHQFLNAEAIARDKKAKAEKKQTEKKSGGGTSQASEESLSADNLSAFGDEEQTSFKRKVYAAQVKNAKKIKTFFPGLSADQMAEVEKGHKMQKEAAGACRKLLAKAREDLAAKQAENDELALQVKAISVGSAYRDPAQDFKIWDGLFSKYYEETKTAREELEGGAHGDKAVQHLAGYISKYKAAGGFSNHSSGIAVDFVTKEGKETLGADKSQNPRWKKSWFHKWLVDHAGTYGFQPLSTEAWHWDYRGVADEPGRPDSH